MKLKETLRYVLKEQARAQHKIPVNLTLVNGNIYLKSFYIISLDERTNIIRGLTAQEEYTYLREDRDPVFCYLKLEEIGELVYEDLLSEQAKISAVNVDEQN